MRRLFAIAGLVVVVAPLAQAAEWIDTYPDWDGNITSGWFRVGQSFEVDPINTTFQNLRFSMAPGVGNIQVQVYKFDANGPTGPALFNRTIARPSGGGQIYIDDVQTVLFAPGGGATYGFVVDMLGSNAPSTYFNGNRNSYNQGHAFFHDNTGWQAFGGLNLTFRAEFSALPEPGTMIAVGVGVAGLLARRRKGRSVSG